MFMNKNQDHDNLDSELESDGLDERPDLPPLEPRVKSNGKDAARKGRVVELFSGFFTRNAKKQKQEKVLARRQKLRLRDIIRIIIMTKQVMQRMQRELKLDNNQAKRKQMLGSLLKMLLLSAKVPNRKDANEITMQIASISNLTDAKQSLCMRIIIDQIRSDPSFPPDVAAALENIAKKEFARQDGTSDDTLKGSRVVTVSQNTERGNVISM